MARVALRRVPVTAIHIDDLEGVLKRLRVHEEVLKGRAKCYFCGTRLSLDNIGGFLMVNGKLALVCDRPDCLAKAAKVAFANLGGA